MQDSFGIGLPHLGVEAVIAVTNKLLMHYGCNTATGQLMQTLYSLFFSELGLSFTPLQESYSRYSFIVTHSWMKTLWEKVSKFDIKIVMTAVSQKFPREGNQFIMQVLAQKGYDSDALLWLNRVRISLQLLFMSDILTASGNIINTEILSRRLPEVSNSDMRWPQEQPTNSDMQLWKNTILSICPSRCTTYSVGRFISNTHRLWLGWEIRSEFRGIPRFFRFRTFWTPEFSSEFYFFLSRHLFFRLGLTICTPNEFVPSSFLD